MSYRKPEDFIVNQDLQKEININSEDLNGKNSQDFQRANDPQIELEVEDFLVTFFESKKLISDINLQLLDKSIKPIIIHTHNTVQYYIKKNETSSINQYFNPQNQAGVVSIYPQLNEFDLFAERIQKDAKQINKNQVVIEIPDQDLYRQIQEQNKIQKPQDSLTSQQIKSIREDGTFTVQLKIQIILPIFYLIFIFRLKRDGVETWEIPESLFLSQKHLRNLRYDSNQKYSEPEIFRLQIDFFSIKLQAIKMII